MPKAYAVSRAAPAAFTGTMAVATDRAPLDPEEELDAGQLLRREQAGTSSETRVRR
jgi:hypothetical protein